MKNFNDALFLFSLLQMLELESERWSKWLKMLDNWEKYANSDKAIFYLIYCLACFSPSVISNLLVACLPMSSKESNSKASVEKPLSEFHL